jgi:PEP-CTERM motif
VTPELPINLGSYSGPAVDLTFGYKLVADGSGGFGFDFAAGDPHGTSTVPEPSTWALMLLGFAGLASRGIAGRERATLRSPPSPPIDATTGGADWARWASLAQG